MKARAGDTNPKAEYFRSFETLWGSFAANCLSKDTFLFRVGKVSLRCATAYVDFFVVRFSQPKVTRKQQS